MLDAAVTANMVDLLGDGCHAQRVRDDNDGVLLCDVCQCAQQGSFAVDVKIVAGLVKNKNRGVAQEQLG